MSLLRTLGNRRLWAAVLTVALVWSFCAPWCAELEGGAVACAATGVETEAPCTADCHDGAHHDCACACPHAPGLTSGASSSVALLTAGLAPAETQRPPSPSREPILHVPIA
ncbi:MAG: hypothetical protein ACYDA8_04300 [Deferrisomatales bacterium]